jgi:phage terminase large subunit
MSNIHKIEYTRHFAPLVDGTPYDFANIYGGRASMKTETTARLALMLGIQRDMRICFARETMSSMKESSHEALTNVIFEHGMAESQNGPYRVLEDRIVRRENGEDKSQIIFVGIRERVRDSKGLARINLTVVEEAAKVSDDSWTVFIPTVMREPGAQMWVVWNPELVSDSTYQRFMLHPPSNCLKIYTTYRDNPWASDITKQLAADCLRDTPKKYAHIWLGEAQDESEGAIYQEEMRKALEDGRICDVPYIKGKPVSTAWDLGMGDPTCVLFIQAYDGMLNVIDYLEVQDKYLTDIMVKIQQKGYLYDAHYLPHDGVDAIIHRKFTGSAGRPDLSISPLSVLRNAGWEAHATDKLNKSTTLDNARAVLANTRFDKTKCALLVDHLRFYAWDKSVAEVKVDGGKRAPLHNEHCHGAEAFQVAAVKIKAGYPASVQPPPPPRRRPMGEKSVHSWMG